MIITPDYRLSHTSPGKGIEYSESFQKLPYLRYLWDWEKNILRQVVEQNFSDPKAVQHLDFACGTGRIIGHLEQIVGKSVGVDVSDAMLEVALRNVRKSELIKVDLTKENIFKGKQFELITAFRFFLNAQESLRNEVMGILAKTLCPEGRLVFNVHMNKTSIHAKLTRFKFKVTRRAEILNSLSIAEVNRMVSAQGLQIQNIYHFGLLPVKVKSQMIPIGLLDLIETPASRVPFFTSFSSQLIFVCKRKS
jgi:predicted TPR repeat methyltransferase